jgi:hypothetical protein
MNINAGASEYHEMIEYINKNIPQKDSIVSLPGNVTVYYATKRIPPLPFFQYLSSTFPYTPQYYSDTIESKKIDWVILKNNLSNIENIGIMDISFIESHLNTHYNLKKAISGYHIYKRSDY